jgi:hypothetical protein
MKAYGEWRCSSTILDLGTTIFWIRRIAGTRIPHLFHGTGIECSFYLWTNYFLGAHQPLKNTLITIRTSCILSRTVLMRFVCFSGRTVITSLSSIYWYAFAIATQCVFCEEQKWIFLVDEFLASKGSYHADVQLQRHLLLWIRQNRFLFRRALLSHWPLLWSSGKSFWLQI